MSCFKKIMAVFLLCFSFVLSAEKLEFKDPVPAKNIPDFVKTKLPSIISLRNPLFKGKVQNSNTISGISFHRVSWTYNGIPVAGKFTVVKEKNGKVVNILNGIKDFSIDTKPALSPEKAAAVLEKNLSGRTLDRDFIARTVIIDIDGEYKLAYRIRFLPENPLDGRYYFVDANTGKLLRSGDLVKHAITNTAKVFEKNPISTPDPIEITLPWLGDDANGKLSAAADGNGLRKIVAANCPDEGDKRGGHPVCTVKQLADKEEHGSFIYEDWENGLSYTFDAEDIYPEIAMYYHLTKMYKYLAELGIDEYTELPNHRGNNPIVGIANYQQYGYDNNTNSYTLQPLDNASYMQYDPYLAEEDTDYYDSIFGDFEYKTSDTLLFGQGKKIDYAYDGDVVYHEFGHGVVHGIAGFIYSGWMDKYGLSNEISGMDEGMADVFSFIISEDPCLGEYVAKGVGKLGGAVSLDGTLCMRIASNENRVNEDFTGESHNDGLPLVGAHWEIYQKILDKGFSKDDFARIFLTALMSVTNSQIGYKEWGELILDAAELNAPALKDDFKKILTDRGYFNEIRARDVTHSASYLYFGGIILNGQERQDTVDIKDENGESQKVAPMYVQLYYDVPECVDTLTISGTPRGTSSTTPELSAFVRKNEPVIWDHSTSPSVVTYDRIVTGSDNKKWVFDNLEPGARYYFHFINTGGIGVLSKPKAAASWNSEEKCAVEPEENDDDTSDADPDDTDSADTADNDPDTGSDTADTDPADSGNTDSADSGSGDAADTDSADSENPDDTDSADSGSDIQPGELGGECYRDNTCDEGLVCEDNTCVKKPEKTSGGCSALSID